MIFINQYRSFRKSLGDYLSVISGPFRLSKDQLSKEEEGHRDFFRAHQEDIVIQQNDPYIENLAKQATMARQRLRSASSPKGARRRRLSDKGISSTRRTGGFSAKRLWTS